MSPADPAFLNLVPAARSRAHRPTGPAERARTTRRWAAGVLAFATTALLSYVAVLMWAAWLLVSVFGGSEAAASFDLLSIGSDFAPALLVGWCTGLATSAVVAGGEALGARTAGTVAGLLGVAAGAGMLALADLL